MGFKQWEKRVDSLASKRVTQGVEMFKKSVKPAKKPNARRFLSVFIWYFVFTAFSLIDSPASYSNDDSLKRCQQTFSGEIDQLANTLEGNPGIMSANQSLNRKTLKVLSAVKTLLKVSETKKITVADYRALNRVIGFGLDDILNYPPELSVRLLSDLYRKSPKVFVEQRARQSARAKNVLIEYFGKEHADVLQRLWEDKSLSDEQMILQFFKLEDILGSNKIDDYVSYLSKYGVNRGNTSSGSRKIDSQTFRNLARVYVHSIQSGASPNANLGRTLNQLLEPKDQTSDVFAQLALAEARQDEKLRNDPVVETYVELFKRAGRGKEEKKLFLKLLDEMMSDPKWDPKLKAGFLLTQVGRSEGGNNGGQFNRYLKLVPENQRELLWGEIERHTMLGVFLDLAKKQDRLLNQGGKLEEMLFGRVLESFQFKTIISQEQAKSGGVTFKMGEGKQAHLVTLTGEYALQVTPMTQLQISLLTGGNPSLLTGGNPSKHKNRGKVIQIGEKRVSLNPGRPVERISWEDVQKQVLEELNRIAEKEGLPFKYDLPTEAQWEYAARGGTKTMFLFKDKADMVRIGWTIENSGGRTHDVAGLRPNPFGLHDMHGNVLEWVKDWYGGYPSASNGVSVTDPSGPNSGSYRVARSAAWHNCFASRSAAYRSRFSPESRSFSVGLRLSRQPR